MKLEQWGHVLHVTSRGNERKAVFKSKRDREKFLEYLETATLRYDAVVHVYCLMDNRYHLLLETPSGNLPQIMRHINGAHTTYFNVKRGRSGHLFQGRYKAILVDADEYAKELSRYIHLNPVRAKMVERTEGYQWSRYTSEPLKKIGRQFKVSESAVSHAVRRVSKTIATDKKVSKKVDNIIGKLKLSRFKTRPLCFLCLKNLVKNYQYRVIL